MAVKVNIYIQLGRIQVKQHIFPLLGVGVAWLLLTAAPVAAAQGEFFVEIGNDVARENAQAEWDALVARHKMLGRLTLYPKDVLQDNRPVTTRLQAGPISSKTAALKICNRLFAADVPCFVIEGVSSVPPAAMMRLNQNMNQNMHQSGALAADGSLPWLSARAEVVEAPKVKGEDTAIDGSARGAVALPWLSGERKAAEAGEGSKQAQVQVAEAIRVPLTETQTLEDAIRVRALPELKPSFGVRPLSDESQEMGSVSSGAGWLDVGYFVNEEIASSLWEEVRSANRKQAKTLNMRLATPAMKDDKVTLSVGPFASSAEAYQFCRSGLQAGERGLSCRFSVNDAGAARGKLLALNAHSDAYAERGRRRPKENPTLEAAQAGKLAPAAGPAKQYWVQVVTADSQMKALKAWEQVKADNSEVLGQLRSSVSASATDKHSYVVRVGPIAENDDAIRVCSQLQKRQVECRVLLYSRGNS